jgi:glycosyltransferase involved in cell wall biosynthesis
MYIFSGYKVYENGMSNTIPHQQLAEYEAIKAECKKVSGIRFSDNISQAQLAREFMKSAILFYPNTFAETFCITAAEALAAGCIPVTSNLGGLASTVGNEGILIRGVPGTEEYDNEFVANVIYLLTNPDELELRSQVARSKAFERFNYLKIAKDFHQTILNRLSRVSY